VPNVTIVHNSYYYQRTRGVLIVRAQVNKDHVTLVRFAAKMFTEMRSRPTVTWRQHHTTNCRLQTTYLATNELLALGTAC